jgi:hypothetical protein
VLAISFKTSLDVRLLLRRRSGSFIAESQLVRSASSVSDMPSGSAFDHSPFLGNSFNSLDEVAKLIAAGSGV